MGKIIMRQKSLGTRNSRRSILLIFIFMFVLKTINFMEKISYEKLGQKLYL